MLTMEFRKTLCEVYDTSSLVLEVKQFNVYYGH